MQLFNVTGTDFFKALTGKYQKEFSDCLEIIFNSYRTELSYGIDREPLILQLTDYFESHSSADIQLDEGADILCDSRGKAAAFLRKLKSYGWIESEFSSDGKEKIIMPNYAVSIMQTLISVSELREMEYQSEVSAVFSMLTSDNLRDRPYPQIIKPVYDRTVALFTELKKLNTGIRKHLDELTDGLTSEELVEKLFKYNDNIASKSYHRLKTSDNVSRFRNTIISRLRDMLSDTELLNRASLEYQNIENCNDKDEAFESILGMITGVIEYFNSYDDIENEITQKHKKYLRSAANRARLAFLSTNNIEGKLSLIIRNLSALCDSEESSIYNDIPQEYCRIFNIFPQNYISSESLKPASVSKKMGDIEEIVLTDRLSEEEIARKRQELKMRNANRFSKKNINSYVIGLLQDKNIVSASDIEVKTRRDMIRVVFIELYGRDKRSEYIVVSKDDYIYKNGFSFRNFEIKRKVK